MRRKLYGYDIQDKRCPGSMRRRLQETSGTASSSSGPLAVPEHVLPLDRVLGEDWAAGAVTSKQVVKYCAAAVALGARSPQVDVFVRCATWGKNGQNAQRDLVKAFGRPLGAPAIYRARLPVKGNPKART